MPLEPLGFDRPPDEEYTDFGKHGYSRRFRRRLGNQLLNITIGKREVAGPGSKRHYSPMAELGVFDIDMAGRVAEHAETFEFPESLQELFYSRGHIKKKQVQKGFRLIADRYEEWLTHKGPLYTQNSVDGFLDGLAKVISPDLDK